MAELRVLAALRIEGYAVGGAVALSGMGRDKALRAPGRHRGFDGDIAVAVAGGSGAPASAVRAAPPPAGVAADLEAAGWRVRTDPIVSSPTFVRAEQRAALGATGALAV